MYTIFSRDIRIILTDNRKLNANNYFLFKGYKSIESALSESESSKIDPIFIYHPKLDDLWNAFKKYFKTENRKCEKAAGGLVKNKKGEILFIFRLNKWDLPKGKIEKGESKKQAAVREVMEECGLDNVKIEKKIQTTYHIFERDGKEILKITYWYLMKTNDKHNLIPQTEEGITDVVFKNEFDVKQALKNTYGNIKLLVHYLDK